MSLSKLRQNVFRNYYERTSNQELRSRQQKVRPGPRRPRYSQLRLFRLHSSADQSSKRETARRLRGGSRGRVQGVHTTPRDEAFFFVLAFKICLPHRSVTSFRTKILDPPLRLNVFLVLLQVFPLQFIARVPCPSEEHR